MIKAVIFDMYETLITHYRTPLYFGAQMAQDIGIPEEEFQKIWHATENDRTVGKMSFEEVITLILKENQKYSPELLEKVVSKRIATKEDCFCHLHPNLMLMLEELKKRNLLIGLISNCFSEEAPVIRKSVLFPYFDAPLLSYEQGIQKPDERIFYRCAEQLGVTPEACLYVGDGGSRELETARALGMQALQALWYLQEETSQPVWRKPDFVQLEDPLEVLRFVDDMCGEK